MPKLIVLLSALVISSAQLASDRPSAADANGEASRRAGGAAPAAVEQDWPFYGGDQAGTKYSPLADINRETVRRLAPAWEWAPHEKALPDFGTRPGAFEVTPLMIDNVLYLSTPYNRVVALNAET